MRLRRSFRRHILAAWLLAAALGGCAAPATPTPTAAPPANTLAPTATRTPRPTGTPPPTLTATPTRTPAPPTATRAPSPTPRPTLDVYVGAATAAPTLPAPPRAVAAVPELLEPGAGGSTLAGGTVFRWAWPGETLREDEYFQPQLFYNGQYYGVVPPTKDYAAAVDPTVRMVLPGVAGYAWVEVTEETLCCSDYTDPSTCRRCTVVVGRERSYDRADWTPLWVEWTVAVVQWDGADPARVGPVVARSAPRPIRV
jgi:hypothetical protein